MGEQDQVWLTERQITLLLVSMLASGLVLVSLFGQREQAVGAHPERNYEYLAPLGKLAALLSAGVSVVWLLMAWKDRQGSPEDQSLALTLDANALAAAASLLKFHMRFRD